MIAVRVLVITNLYPNPYEPNRAVFNAQQFHALAKEHQLRIISPIAWVEEWRHRRIKGSLLPADRCVDIDGVRVEYPRYYYLPKLLRGSLGPCYRWSVRPAFERALRELRPDVILGSWAYPDGWASVSLAKQAGLPVIVKVHGCDVLCGGHGLGRYPARKKKTIAALRGAQEVVAVSRDLASQVRKLGVPPERVQVVYNGVDPAKFSPGSKTAARQQLQLPTDSRLVLFVGSLTPVKGIPTLIAALEKLGLRGVRYQAFLIGQGQLRGSIEADIAKKKLEHSIRLLGGVSHADLMHWYRAADVLVLPSVSEGVPNVLLEAAACGTPFVASNVGGIPEVAEAGRGILVPP